MPESRDDARRFLARRWSRRRMLSTLGLTGLGLGAAALVGCDAQPTTVPVPQPRETRPAATSVPPTASPTPSIRRGGVWRMALAADPGNLDPHANLSVNAKAAAAPVYSRLLAYESGPGKARVSFSTVPDAAEFTQAPDAQTFVVRLNPRAQFTGPVSRPMTSADVKYSVERVLGRGGSNTPTADAQLLSMVGTVETPDERTVTFKLKEPYGAFAPVLADVRALPLLPVETTKAFDPARQMAGSGPFTLKSYEAGAMIAYARNPEWHLGADRPFLDGIEMSIIRDAPAALAQFLGGGLDVLPLTTAADLKRARDGVKGLIVDQSPPLMIQNITFSGLDFEPPWRDVRVRRAVSMAINRDAMLDEAFGVKELRSLGVDIPYTWDGFLPWGITGYSLEPKQMKTERLASFKYNTSEAAKLMDAAGWPNGFGVEWHYTGGFRGGYPLNARLVAQQLREIKIQLRTTVEDYAAVFLGSTVPGNFRGMASIALSLGEPGNYLTAMYLPASPRNTGKINDPRLTDMITAIKGNTNREERRQQILDVQGYLADQMLNVPLPNGPLLTGYQPAVRNVLEYQSHGAAAGVDQVPYYWKA
ncbi:MAG: ABC transporter substrate-binding protein [Dehalococcoidia bacterium]